jgi:hypothetical protein
MRAIRISNSMVEIPVSEDMAAALKLITRTDFNLSQCVDAVVAGRICKKLDSFRSMRSPAEFKKYMEFYRLFDLVDGNEYDEVVRCLKEANLAKVGTSVVIEEEF